MSYLWVFKLILLLKLCRSFDGSLKGYDTKAVRIYSPAAWILDQMHLPCHVCKLLVPLKLLKNLTGCLTRGVAAALISTARDHLAICRHQLMFVQGETLAVEA